MDTFSEPVLTIVSHDMMHCIVNYMYTVMSLAGLCWWTFELIVWYPENTSTHMNKRTYCCWQILIEVSVLTLQSLWYYYNSFVLKYYQNMELLRWSPIYSWEYPLLQAQTHVFFIRFDFLSSFVHIVSLLCSFHLFLYTMFSSLIECTHV